MADREMGYFFGYVELQERCPIFFPPLCELEKEMLENVSPAAKNAARPQSRVALRETSFVAAVAQNGYFDPNSGSSATPQQLLFPISSELCIVCFTEKVKCIVATVYYVRK